MLLPNLAVNRTRNRLAPSLNRQRDRGSRDRFRIWISEATSNSQGVTAVLHRGRGFTLLETAIVVVTLGFLMVGVLKGQELIQGARVHSLIAQQDGIKVAFFAFYDRYRALPGDYAAASANISCGASACLNGNGNGHIEAGTGGAIHEEILAWQHLSAAGFLQGNYQMLNVAAGT